MFKLALTQFLTHCQDVPIVPVPLLHYDSGTFYHRFLATNTPGSDLRVRGSAICSTDFWSRTPMGPPLGSLFYLLDERNTQTKA